MGMTMEISSQYPLPVERPSGSAVGRKSDGRQKVISTLKVGESFHLDANMGSVCALRWWAKARFPEREYTARKEVTGGVRIWRTK
jgi:hypothetical protein